MDVLHLSGSLRRLSEAGGRAFFISCPYHLMISTVLNEYLFISALKNILGFEKG
jgi:hypothetical protein